ncbi:unnamed protein product [Cuscuta epithymum]|uniref:Uncharacterized protein n=1 Tax=Cuscuta epithymum TaxID=186058 RepID=A0AAV0DUW3_9ASTE|nr:unnamed protein product [Cuscuta epithymum]CAH9110342.1 unnamed protein product [Cuscuta epithymum]CAH9145442.1 unnamed protein product [Cuscuta epithymum]
MFICILLPYLYASEWSIFSFLTYTPYFSYLNIPDSFVCLLVTFKQLLVLIGSAKSTTVEGLIPVNLHFHSFSQMSHMFSIFISHEARFSPHSFFLFSCIRVEE